MCLNSKHQGKVLNQESHQSLSDDLENDDYQGKADLIGTIFAFHSYC